MLDAHQGFGALTGQGLHIYWGAYLGTADEILLSGPLDEALARRIGDVRAQARARKGWIMDTYLLRRTSAR
jgi:precorrin-6A synthase